MKNAGSNFRRSLVELHLWHEQPSIMQCSVWWFTAQALQAAV
jgi:hypothetical protein